MVTIFHELAHTVLFFKDNVNFNERFAEFVGRKAAELFYLNREGESSETVQKLQAQWKDELLFSSSGGPLGGANSWTFIFSPRWVRIFLITCGFRMLEMILICPLHFEQVWMSILKTLLSILAHLWSRTLGSSESEPPKASIINNPDFFNFFRTFPKYYISCFLSLKT